MTRIDKLILGVASSAALVAFLSQCPAQADGKYFAAVTLLPQALAGSMAVLLITALAACSFAAMLLSTAMHHKTRRRNAGGPIRSMAVELAWVAIPIAIIVGVAIPASGGGLAW